MKVLMTIPHVGINGPIPKLVALMSQGLRELAVDVIEVVRNRFLLDTFVREILIGSDEFDKEGRKIRVSTIDIAIAKK